MIWGKVIHRFEGLHHWPDADGKHDYLKHPHRHMFHVTVWFEQFHDDREIEYFAFRDWLVAECAGGNMDHKSCEMMALELQAAVKNQWGSERAVRVEVLEDGENGALVE